MDLKICCIVGCELGEIPSSSAGAKGRRKRWAGLGHGGLARTQGKRPSGGKGKEERGSGWSGSARRFWPRGLKIFFVS
jgi:hypothetical protein